MSKLDELIKELCPNGCEYKKVGDICDTITDYTAAGSFADIAKNVKYINDKIGYAQLVRTTDLKSKFENSDKFVYVNEHAFKYLWRVNLDKECLVLPNVGNCGEVYYVTPDILPCSNNVLGPNAILVKSNSANNKYLFHLFQNDAFQKDLAKITSTTGQTKFNKTNFKALQIPLPPMAVQEEIVRILDNFTALTAELTARKKQYEYYRDELLTFGDGQCGTALRECGMWNVECGTALRECGTALRECGMWNVECGMSGRSAPNCNNVTRPNGCEYKSLKEVCTNIIVPMRDRPKVFDGNIPWCRIEDKEGHYFNKSLSGLGVTEEVVKKMNLKVFPTGTVICSCSASLGAYAINTQPLITNQTFIGLVCGENLFNKYLLYYMETQTTYLKGQASTGTIPYISRQKFENMQIPVPPMAVQEEIVRILDRFDSLCNDISEGLPAEIEARQKQYEFYRDALLNYAAKGVAEFN